MRLLLSWKSALVLTVIVFACYMTTFFFASDAILRDRNNNNNNNHNNKYNHPTTILIRNNPAVITNSGDGSTIENYQSLSAVSAPLLSLESIIEAYAHKRDMWLLVSDSTRPSFVPHSSRTTHVKWESLLRPAPEAVYIPHGDIAVVASAADDEDKTTAAILRLAGRARKLAIVITTTTDRNSCDALVKAFAHHQPGFEFVPSSTITRGCVFKRPAFLLTFALTEGGRDGKHVKAIHVERTWGRRTPLVWYSDVAHTEVQPHIVGHALYTRNKFDYLSFKLTAIWQHVYDNYFQMRDERRRNAYEYYIRLWDDNYFYEENFYRLTLRIGSIARRRGLTREFDPYKRAICYGKVGFRYMSAAEQHFFLGGGAGWFITAEGMRRFAGENNASKECDTTMLRYEHRKDIFLAHALHDEDILLSICMTKKNVTFYDVPGIEHVSPGSNWRQRCVSDVALKKLRWDDGACISYAYPTKKPEHSVDALTWTAYTKPVVWHYMSPRRLVSLELLLYPERKQRDFPDGLPAATVVDAPKRGRGCYPGIATPTPVLGQSEYDVGCTNIAS
eukprot:PhM_4_TR5328/c1_g1_i1/m.21792